MLYRGWKTNRPDAAKAEALAKALGTGRLLADVLVARGYDTPEAAAALLAEDAHLSDPFLLKDMDKAVECINEAIENEEPIVIFGDYDVDGVTATALLYSCLLDLGAITYYKLANRSDDGYGLSVGIVDEIADKGIGLIITVDNGISAHDAALRASERGVKLVVTDHHLPPETLPEAVAVVDPCRDDDESPFQGFCGAGVAFLLAAALAGCDADDLLPEYGDLAAIGTVADVMQLTGENRTLVREGLRYLQDTRRPGLAALMRICGFAEKEITAETISFGLAPRLNAAGRMDDATDALRLLLAVDDEEGEALASLLQQRNTDRQQTELSIVEEITAQIEADTALQRARVLVVWGEGWHQGIIGIVANRLVDRYAKPAVVIAVDGEEGRGSGRSIQGFSLYGALASCSDILVRYGGHDIAAGLSIQPQHLEAFRKRLNEWAAKYAPVVPPAELVADCPVQVNALTVQEVAGLARLAPCGSGNPAPKFLLENMYLDAVYPVSEGRHSRLRVRAGDGGMLHAVLFGTGPDTLPYKPGDAIDVLVSLSVYEGKAGPMVSARVIELRPAGLGNTHVDRCMLFEHFYAGGVPTAEARELIRPSREDAAKVYRAITNGKPVHYTDLRPLFQALGEEASARALCVLAAFEELGLVRKNEAKHCYETVKVAEKRPLENSELLQRLEV